MTIMQKVLKKLSPDSNSYSNFQQKDTDTGIDTDIDTYADIDTDTYTDNKKHLNLLLQGLIQYCR